jgi:hypothetical protein
MDKPHILAEATETGFFKFKEKNFYKFKNKMSEVQCKKKAF